MYELVMTPFRRLAITRTAPIGFVFWFGFGLSVGVLMVANSQLTGDQVQMLNLGWQLSHNHRWISHGMITSAGGFSPGGFAGLLIAAPLMLWNDYRAPALFILLLNAGAFLLLVRALRAALTPFGVQLLLVLGWLSPWHLYFAAHVWDPNFMFVFAVLHLVTAQRMAQYKETGTTAAHVLLIGLGLQVHTSVAILCILSAVLFFTGRLKVCWTGCAIGMGVCGASLVPWFLAAHQDPTLIPGDKGFLFRGLVYVYPVLRGVIYWVKLSSLSFVRRMYALDFRTVVGPVAGPYLTAAAKALLRLANVTLILSAWLQWRFFRKAYRQFVSVRPAEYRPRSWLRFYVTAMCAAALIAFALSPTTIMFWQVFIAMPASVIAVAMSAEVLARSRWKRITLRVARIWVFASAAILLSQAVAAPMYRCGGRILNGSRPMLEDLHVRLECLEHS